jgi:ethanolamine utilization protein EutJ
VGVDLGTANIVLTVVDGDGRPRAIRSRAAQVVRDGLVVDFIGAADIVRELKSEAEAELGFPLTAAASGYPPGVPEPEVRAVANVLAAAGLECVRLIDEPSAANLVLRIQHGALIDIGGGTTGVAYVQAGQVVDTADEATGGTHFTLVIAGALGVSLEEAESLKLDPARQPDLLPLVRPVMEKVATILARHLANRPVPVIHLVGGASAFYAMDTVIEETLGIPVHAAPQPLLVTPLGLALAHRSMAEPALAAGGAR